MRYYPSLINHIPRDVQKAQISSHYYIKPGVDITMDEIVGEEDSIRRVYFRKFLEIVVFDKVTARDPMMPTKRLYALAKAFFDQLIGDMSLNDMGVMFEGGDMSDKASRARWSWRIKKWIAQPMKEKGYVHHLTYGKNQEASAKYAEAAKRTKNRAKK